MNADTPEMAVVTVVCLALAVGLLLLWSQVSRLSTSLEDVQAKLRRLEGRPEPQTGASDAPIARPEPTIPTPQRVANDRAARTRVETPTPVPRARPAALQPSTPPLPPAHDDVVDAADAQGPDADWEIAVGASWANKVGAVVTVIGLALAIGYSMTTLGPAGRIGVGFAASGLLLGVGTFFERRPAFRLYSYGLTAAGWAATYFTAYAMRNVPAAQVISSDALGTLLLLAVAAAMIWHTLRYRSRTVTILTYLIAFTTLGMSPLTTFSVVACLPLTVSLLVIAERHGWSDLSALGVAASYVIFTLRSQAGPVDVLDAATWPSWAMLASLWLTFEGADLLSRLRRPAPHGASVFALNAVGFMASGLLHAPDSDVAIGAFAAAASAAYLVSAVARVRLLPAAPAGEDAGDGLLAGWTSSHAAVALAAAAASLAIELRFDGLRQVGAYLLMTEMLFIAGLVLGDRIIRHLGAALALFTTLQLIQAGLRPGTIVTLGPVDVERWSLLGLVFAGAWYAHREWLRARSLVPQALEYACSWAGTLIVSITIGREFQTTDAAVAGLAFAAVLLDVGLRRRGEYRYQSYLVGAVAAGALALLFAGDVVALDSLRHWLALPTGAALVYWMSWRVARIETDGADTAQLVAGVGATLGTLLVAVFEHEALPALWLGPAFAATGLMLTLVDRWQHLAIFRWHAYALLVAGLTRAGQPVLTGGPATQPEVLVLIAAAVMTYAGTLIMRAGVRRASGAPGWIADVEGTLRPAVSVVATGALALLTLAEAPDRVRTVLWSVHGVALLVAGVPFRERVMRLSGLAMLGLAVGRFFVHDFSEQEALARIMSAVALGVFLLGVSWVYTRYRDRIQRFL